MSKWNNGADADFPPHPYGSFFRPGAYESFEEYDNADLYVLLLLPFKRPIIMSTEHFPFHSSTDRVKVEVPDNCESTTSDGLAPFKIKQEIKEGKTQTFNTVFQ